MFAANVGFRDGAIGCLPGPSAGLVNVGELAWLEMGTR